MSEVVVGTWFLYGLVEWYGSEWTLISLDTFNKALFGLFVGILIRCLESNFGTSQKKEIETYLGGHRT